MNNLIKRQLLTYGAVYVISLSRYARALREENKKLVKQHNELAHRFNDMNQEYAYLVHLLNKHGVELDTFDLQILQQIRVQSTKE